MPDNIQNTRPFGMRDKIGYMCGDLANDFTFIFASGFLLKFYTDVLGVDAYWGGILFLVARLVDAFTDVGMGRIVDTMAPAKDGRFRPWLRRMAIPIFIINVLMYLHPAARLPMTGRIVYMFATYILWGSVCYTAANIPYGSMASVITEDPGERTSLSTFRSVGAMLAGGSIGVLTPMFLFKQVGDQSVLIPERYTLLAIIYGGLALIAYLVCYKLCVERVQLPTKKVEKGTGFFSLVNALVKNRALMAIIGAAICMLLCQLLGTSMLSYVFQDYFHDANLMIFGGVATALPTLALAPFSRKLSDRFGKKECSIVGCAIATLFYGALFLIHTHSPVVYISMMLIGSVGMGFFNMVIWAFITDIIDYQEVHTGNRDDGTVYAIYSFSRKLGQAIAGGVSGFALSMIGYVSATAGQAVQQTEQALDGIYNISTLVPTLGYLAVMLLLLFAYPLGKKQVEENAAILRQRHAERDQQN